MNRHTNSVCVMDVSCFEILQGMFRCGIMLPDGQSANGIGRCKNTAQFMMKAAHGGTRVL